MLLDLQRHGADVDLLDHDRLGGEVQLQSLSARRAEVQDVIVRRSCEHFGREEDTLVTGVAGLSAGLARGLALAVAGLGGLTMSEEGGLEEVVRGILVRRGELLLQLNDGRLKGIEPRLQAIELRLQPLAIRTRGCCVPDHGARFYPPEVQGSTL